MKIFARLALLLGYIFFSITTLNAQDIIVLDKDFQSKTIGKQVSYWLDDLKTAQIEDILKPNFQQKFKKSENDNLNFGFFSGSVWLKIQVRKTPNLAHNFLIELPYPPLDSIRFYTQSSSLEWHNVLNGDHIPYKFRPNPSRNYVFPLTLKDSVTVFYINIRSKGSIQIPIKIYEHNYHNTQIIYEEIFYGFFFGVMMMIAFYNLFLFFPLRDLNYLLYFFYIVAITTALGTLSGHTAFYFKDYSVWWGNTALPFTIQLSLSLALIFSLSFLEPKKYSKTAQTILASLIGYNILCTALTLCIAYNFAVVLAVFSILISAIPGLSVVVYVLYKGNRAARFFLMAWLSFILGAVLIALRSLGILPHIFITSFGAYLGVMIEGLLLAFALADRIALYQRARDEALEKALQTSLHNEQIIKKQNQILEEKVLERTRDLEAQQAEIMAQNEELSQQKELLSNQSDFIAQQNLDLKENIERIEIQNLQIEKQAKHLEEINYSKDRIFAIIGHDLQTPINSLKALMDLMTSSDITPDDFLVVISKLKNGVEYVHFTLRNLLTWANSQLQGIICRPQKCNLKELAEESLNLLSEFANLKRIHFNNQIHQDLWAWADKEHIRLVFRNLVSNAIKFTPEEGTIIFTAKKHTEMIEVSIIDNGVGILPEQIEKLFNALNHFTTKGTSGEKGTGLGLMLCKELLEKNAGKIWVESEPNKGTVFTFAIPEWSRDKS